MGCKNLLAFLHRKKSGMWRNLRHLAGFTIGIANNEYRRGGRALLCKSAQSSGICSLIQCLPVEASGIFMVWHIRVAAMRTTISQSPPFQFLNRPHNLTRPLTFMTTGHFYRHPVHSLLNLH